MRITDTIRFSAQVLETRMLTVLTMDLTLVMVLPSIVLHTEQQQYMATQECLLSIVTTIM